MRVRKLSDAEMAVYRRPYKNPGESRRPTLTWPNQTHLKITGGHFLQEDSPDETGAAIVAWLQNLRH
jgi:haloalkane dehalogenase